MPLRCRFWYVCPDVEFCWVGCWRVTTITWVQIEALKGKQIMSVACGAGHTAALSKDGELFMWGRGRHGQLGRGERTESQASKLVVPEVRSCYVYLCLSDLC